MAWRSSGSTNDEMVDNLKRFHVISSPDVEAAFRNVDRKWFVPKDCQDIAHKDQPIRNGNIHISAPHIYGSVVEALELKKDAGYSVLNAGSGTGYLTCIAASILGPRSVHHCVEIHEDVLKHSREAIAAWKEATASSSGEVSNIDFIHGNALELTTNKGECALGFDRIYIGASIEKLNLYMFKKMLKPGGVLVGPVDDELIQIVRSLSEHAQGNQLFSTKVLSAVRFAPLLTAPSLPVVIPARVWEPSNHGLYPDTFRGACQQLLLCSNASTTQPVKICQRTKINAASMLPRALWVEILSYTHRNWFDVPLNEVDFLRRRLAEEQANVERANRARREAESRYRVAERERDIYKILARTLRSRLHGAPSDDSDESPEEYTLAMLLMERTPFGLGRVLRSAPHGRGDEEMGDEDFEFSEDDNNDDDNYDDHNDDDHDDNDSDGDSDDDDEMEDAVEHLEEEEDNDDDDDDESEDDASLSVASNDSHAPSHFIAETIPMFFPHSRKVSVSEGDIR